MAHTGARRDWKNRSVNGPDESALPPRRAGTRRSSPAERAPVCGPPRDGRAPSRGSRSARRRGRRAPARGSRCADWRASAKRFADRRGDRRPRGRRPRARCGAPASPGLLAEAQRRVREGREEHQRGHDERDPPPADVALSRKPTTAMAMAEPSVRLVPRTPMVKPPSLDREPAAGDLHARRPAARLEPPVDEREQEHQRAPAVRTPSRRPRSRASAAMARCQEPGTARRREARPAPGEKASRSGHRARAEHPGAEDAARAEAAR